MIQPLVLLLLLLRLLILLCTTTTNNNNNNDNNNNNNNKKKKIHYNLFASKWRTIPAKLYIYIRRWSIGEEEEEVAISGQIELSLILQVRKLGSSKISPGPLYSISVILKRFEGSWKYVKAIFE